MFCRSIIQSYFRLPGYRNLFVASASILNISKQKPLIPVRNSSDKPDKDSLLEKYFIAKQAYEADLPPPDVNPLGVFANNELDLSDIEVYGFDYDYTLAVYKESLHYLIYDLGRDWLINKFKYPAEIRQLDYQPGFAIRGLHYDMQKGLLMKIDSFHQIQFESVYRGMTPLTKDEVVDIYGGSYIPQELIRGSSTEVNHPLTAAANDDDAISTTSETILLHNDDDCTKSYISGTFEVTAYIVTNHFNDKKLYGNKTGT